MLRTCVVIPVYNHHSVLPTIVARLVDAGLHCFLVDDGSEERTRTVVAELSESYAGVYVHRLPENMGKGVAVLTGLRIAAEQGFSHAVQVDADGQHDVSQIGEFIRAAETDPEALVSGRPVYDASVPRARLYGRYVTHVWVWIETLSLAIEDSMCGFRVYPIRATLAVADGVSVGRRMDFDTEIMVRMYWAGVNCRFIPTHVTYPEDGVSHFKVLADNVRISAMHTRLFFGMLRRLPRLLARRSARSRHWAATRERGSEIGMRATVLAFRLLGRRFSHILLWPVAAYFYLFNVEARHASQKFLAQAGSYAASASTPKRPGLREGLRHFHAFAAAGMDKFIAWRDPSRIAVTVDRPEDLKAALADGRGALLISAHLGNPELARALSQVLPDVTVNALVYTQHAKKFTGVLAAASERYGVRLYQVKEIGPATAIALRSKIDAGEIVVIVGDRTPVAEISPVVTVPFLGMPAPFAIGPYVLAHVLECPVYLFFCLAEGRGYTLYHECFSQRIELPRASRQARLQTLAADYASRLGEYALRYPLQWFNFFDFWTERRVSAGRVSGRE